MCSTESTESYTSLHSTHVSRLPGVFTRTCPSRKKHRVLRLYPKRIRNRLCPHHLSNLAACFLTIQYRMARHNILRLRYQEHRPNQLFAGQFSDDTLRRHYFSQPFVCLSKRIKDRNQSSNQANYCTHIHPKRPTIVRYDPFYNSDATLGVQRTCP